MKSFCRFIILAFFTLFFTDTFATNRTITWTSIALSNYCPATTSSYTLIATNTNNANDNIPVNGIVTITFPAGTDATSYTGGTFYNGTAIPIGTTTITATSISFPAPIAIPRNVALNVILNNITNPAAATYNNLTMTVPNAGAAPNTSTFSGSSYTIIPLTITTNPVSTPLCKGASVNVPFTVGTCLFNAGNTFTAQLSDASGSFASPVNIGTLSGTTSGTIPAAIPVGTTDGFGYLIRVVGSNPSVIGTTNSNGNITISTPMTYSVSAVNQITGSISQNCSLPNAILEIKINVTGSCSPQTITQFNFNTASSTNSAVDITKAKVYYTGQTQGFTTSQQFGGDVFAPTGNFTVNGTQQLSFGAGTYYFYLEYEIPSTATTGDVVDASLTSFVMNGTTITDMSTPDPAGNRTIVNGSTCSYSITKFPDLYFCGSTYTTAADRTVNFSLIESSLGNEFDASQTNKTIVFSLPPGFAFDAGGTVNPSRGNISAITLNAPVAGATSFTVTVSTNGAAATLDSIDFHNFKIYPTGPGSGDLLRTGGTFSIKGSAGNPTSSQSFGHMSAGAPMAYQSSAVVQYDTTDIKKNCTNSTNGILEIQVNVTNPCEPINVSRFDFNTAGSTNPTTDITEAEIYYTGQTRGLNYGSWFGLTPNPNGAFSITGSQDLTLGAGTYYFYLVYDVPSTATLGDKLDASMTSFVIAGVTQTDMSTPNPTGARTISTGTCSPTPDVANPPANNQTATAGSLVIPMDNAHQNLYGGLSFNLRAYGLVHMLLMNDIPLKWVIKSGKAKDAPDFIASASRVYPSAVAAATQTFVASEFIIDSQYVNRSFYPGGKTATQVITAFNGGNPAPMVAVYKLTADVIVDVRYTLTARPKIAIFSNGGNQAIHKAMLDTARITNYIVQNAGDFQGLASCYTFCSEAHWDYTPGNPIKGNLDPVKNVVAFVNEGGNFLAQCAGIDLYENHQPDGGHFHTTDGIGFANGNVTNTFSNADMAFDQFQGTIGPLPNSTIAKFWPNPSTTPQSKYKPEMFVGVSAPLPTNTVVATGAHLADPDSIGSNVFYLGGHSYATTSIGDINGSRMYLNATLIPAKRPTAFQANMNPPTTICVGQSYQLSLGGNPAGPAGAIYTWTPCDGSLNNCNSPNPVATPSVTTTYFVYINNNGCPGTGQVTITVVPKPTSTITAVSSQTVCANNASITLSASVTNATGGIWTSNSGTGTFSPNATTLSNVVYTPSAGDIATGKVTFTLTSTGNNASCSAATSTLTVFITPAPTVNAGNDTTVCASNRNVTLKGKITIASGGIWSTPNGTGTFSPNAPTGTYVVSDADTALHSVKLVLTTTGNGSCNAVTDTMVIFITPGPKATVGAVKSTTVCANQLVDLTGSRVTNGTGVWTSSGGGIFSPAAPQNATSYSLSSTDKTTGVATLTLTVTGSGTCGATKVQDVLNVTITPLPIALTGLGSTLKVCANDSVIHLSSKVIANGTGAWTSSRNSGKFSPSDNGTASTYTLSKADTAAHRVTLYLTVTGAGLCGTVQAVDSTLILISPEPRALTGYGDTLKICAHNKTVSLSQRVIANGHAVWASSSGSGVFTPAADSTATAYVLSNADTAAHHVTLYLRVTGTGVCGTVQAVDSTLIVVTPEPIALTGLGSTLKVCANDSVIHLSSRVIANGTGAWTSSRNSGKFSPSANGTASTYTLSKADTAAHRVTLYLTVTGAGLCGTVQAVDSTVILISPEPRALTGNGNIMNICAHNKTVSLSQRIIANGHAVWTSSSGSGVFTPAADSTATAYVLSNADTAAHHVTLYLRVTGTGVCGTVQAVDSTLIVVTPEPIALTGYGRTLKVCAHDSVITLTEE